MTDFATLGMDVDSSGLVRGRDELGRLTDAGGRAERGAANLQKAFGSLGDTIRKWAGPAAIGLAINKLRSMTSVAMANIDAQAKLARAVGGTTAGFQALGRAGDRSGVQQSEMAAAVTRLNQRLGQVIATGKGADDTFRAIGLSAQQLSGMDIDERFMAISRAMQDAGMSTQEMSFHLRELGIRQASVITLIQGGAEEIERSQKVLRDFGVAVSEVDAASIERANDALSEVGRVFEGLRNQMAIRLAPAIEATANAFTAMAMEGGPVFRLIRGFVDQLPRLISYLQAAIAGGAAYGAVLVTVAAAKWGLVAATNGLRVALTRLGIPVLIIAFGELWHQVTRLATATGSVSDAFSLVRDVVVEVAERIGMRIAAIGKKIAAFALGVESGFKDAMAATVEAVGAGVRAVAGGVEGVINIAIQGITSLVNIGIAGINKLIELANKVPGIDIGTVGEFGGGEFALGGGITAAIDGVAEGLRNSSNAARQAAIDTGAYADILNELAGQPLQSVNALKEVIEDANAALTGGEGEGVAPPGAGAALGAMGGEEGGAGAGGGAGGLLGGMERLNELLGQFQEQDPRAAIEAWHMEAMSALHDANLIERGMMEDHNAYKLEIERIYQQQLMALRRQETDQTLGHYQSFFGTMAGALQSGGEKMLKISKGFGLAEAAVSMWRGAAKALELPFPASLSAWGQVIATGMKSIRGIQSARPGSTGGAASSGGGGGGSQSQAAQVATQRLRFEIAGSGPEADAAFRTLQLVQQAIDNGGRLDGIVAERVAG